MANTFIAINRGNDGFRYSDFTIGTVTSAATDFELRIAGVDGTGATPTKKDVYNALKAFMRALEDPNLLNIPPL
jgi:hypothetical protein